MASWDVIVIGLGGVGSATTYQLARNGHRVLGIDRYPAAHDRGSSHGQTRIIRQAYFEHPAYVPLLRRAYELWDEAEAQFNAKLFHRTGLVEVGPADGIVIPGVLRSAEAHGLEIETLSTAEVSRRWPGISGEADSTAVIERDAGFLRVEDCVRAHLQLAHQAGASCIHGAQVLRWETDGDGVIVVTDQGVERAASLVIAAGPWAASLLGNLNVNLQLLRKHLYWFKAETAGYDLEDGFPCFFHETDDGFFYGFPSIDGSGVKVARHSGGEKIEQPEHPHPLDEIDRKLVDKYVASCLPGVGNQLVAQTGCFYTMSSDEHFIIDQHPDHAQVTVVAGLSGHGFKFTSVLGEIASQLATAKKTNFNIDLFVINRIC